MGVFLDLCFFVFRSLVKREEQSPHLHPYFTHNHPQFPTSLCLHWRREKVFSLIINDLKLSSKKNLRMSNPVSTFASLTNNLKSILMSLNSLIFNVSNGKQTATFIAHLGEKPHFVVMRGGRLQTFDYASEFVNMANHYFNIDGFSSDSMSLDGGIYIFHHETMQVILKSLLHQIEEKSQG